MIAIGGSIGAGLFVGSGSALNTGGPGALLLVSKLSQKLVFREYALIEEVGLWHHRYHDVQCGLRAW